MEAESGLVLERQGIVPMVAGIRGVMAEPESNLGVAGCNSLVEDIAAFAGTRWTP